MTGRDERARMDGPASSVSPGAANGGGDARRCRRAAAVAHVEEAEKQLRSSESLCLRTVVCALLGPRPRVLREQAAHQRPIMCERTRPFHWQTQACVCSGSAEDVSSLCRAKRLQVFIFQLDSSDSTWTIFKCFGSESTSICSGILGAVSRPFWRVS